MAATVAKKMLESLHFDNTFVRDLPADPISQADREKGNVPRQVANAAYSRVMPTKVRSPRLISYSPECAKLVDLTDEECKRQMFADIMGGNSLFPGGDPYSACYGGHQFGNWAGQLGDGRAICLGEVVNRYCPPRKPLSLPAENGRCFEPAVGTGGAVGVFLQS